MVSSKHKHRVRATFEYNFPLNICTSAHLHFTRGPTPNTNPNPAMLDCYVMDLRLAGCEIFMEDSITSHCACVVSP